MIQDNIFANMVLLDKINRLYQSKVNPTACVNCTKLTWVMIQTGSRRVIGLDIVQSDQVEILSLNMYHRQRHKTTEITPNR